MRPILFLACAAALSAQQPRGINFYSIEKEIALGDRLAAEFQRGVTVAPDARVERLGAALVPQASPFHYRFLAFDGSPAEDGAVTFPGGPVFVPRSLAARDDRQLAAILAHAIAHVELRHGTRLATRKELIDIGAQMDALVASTVLLKLQRSFELAADLHAIQLLRAAGFDPASLVEYLRTMAPIEHPVFSAYPTPQERVRAVEKAIADLQQ